MFTVRDLAQPGTIEEAYLALMSRKTNTVLGGCAFLRLGNKRIGTAIDLSKLNLRFIRQVDGWVEIGAMATLRDIETSSIFQSSFGGLLPKAVANIVGVQFRNGATVGASVFARYGFSDLLTALLVLDSEVELFHGGRLSLAEFLSKPFERDILTKVWVRLNSRQAAYQSLRNSASDYPILNVAVSSWEDRWIIAAGARPQKARIAQKASQFLAKGPAKVEEIAEAAHLAAEELNFGTNMRATAGYRQALSKVLVQRAITEVWQCR